VFLAVSKGRRRHVGQVQAKVNVDDRYMPLGCMLSAISALMPSLALLCFNPRAGLTDYIDVAWTWLERGGSQMTTLKRPNQSSKTRDAVRSRKSVAMKPSVGR